MKNLELAVLESRWSSKGNLSVRDMFNILAEIHCNNPRAYYYEMFNDVESIKKIISSVTKEDRTDCIYIACHGNQNEISDGHDGVITTQQLRDVLEYKGLNGVYFGSCEFMNERNAKLFFDQKKYISAWWIAGFSKNISWLSSSVFDILFWDIYFSIKNKNKKLRQIDLIEEVAITLKEKAGGLCYELGFDIYVLKKGGSRLIHCLISDTKIRT